jgi:hypothetical protein
MGIVTAYLVMKPKIDAEYSNKYSDGAHLVQAIHICISTKVDISTMISVRRVLGRCMVHLNIVVKFCINTIVKSKSFSSLDCGCCPHIWECDRSAISFIPFIYQLSNRTSSLCSSTPNILVKQTSPNHTNQYTMP